MDDAADAAERTLTVLRFFWTSPQGTAPHATGYKGFYYHFLDMITGRRAGSCELSTIDTALLLAGMLTSATYFDQDCADEREIRTLADALYRRTNWQWAQNGGATITHGWKPESGFLKYRWEGYDEALLVYVLGLGSPTCALPTESYSAWTSTYEWKEIYWHEFLYGSSLFMHQFSHLWIDFRGIYAPSYEIPIHLQNVTQPMLAKHLQVSGGDNTMTAAGQLSLGTSWSICFASWCSAYGLKPRSQPENLFLRKQLGFYRERKIRPSVPLIRLSIPKT